MLDVTRKALELAINLGNYGATRDDMGVLDKFAREAIDAEAKVGAEYPRRAVFSEDIIDRVVERVRSASGPTNREQIAAMAMQALLSNSRREAWYMDAEKVAEASTLHADALIAELQKPSGASQ